MKLLEFNEKKIVPEADWIIKEWRSTCGQMGIKEFEDDELPNDFFVYHIDNGLITNRDSLEEAIKIATRYLQQLTRKKK